MLETLQVVFLAPSATAGSISMEREKQTLELLVVTPITSVAIVLGKLLSALVYVWLLIAASVPLTAVVFLYGGVAPEDVVRGYLVLIVTALGLGAFGLFCSSLVKRTQAATAITIFGVLVMTIGSVFVLIFWQAMATADNGQGSGPIKGAPPQVIAYLNPFLAAGGRVVRHRDDVRRVVLGRKLIAPDPERWGRVRGPGRAGPHAVGRPGLRAGRRGRRSGLRRRPRRCGAVRRARDAFWPKSIVAWLVVSLVLLLLTVQFVSPTRRWRLRRGRRQPVASS